MLKLVVVDSSAEARNRVVQQITALLRSDIPDIGLLPQMSIKALSREELKFHAAPDIVIVGDELVAQDLTNVGQIRKALPTTPMLVRVTATNSRLAVVEQIARMGADDVWPADASPHEFLRKLVLLSRKVQKAKSGKLIVVDGGKGGVGVTSVVAAMAESLIGAGKKVLVIDLDSQTQDLSRFLQARPFVNENLQLLLEQSRPVTQESVEQSLASVWQDEPALACMPPVADNEALIDPRSSVPRLFMQVLEVVDALFDCVIVDVASTQGAFLRTLYRVADKIVFVVNSDPAALYASVDRLSRVRSSSAPDARLLVVENATSRAGLAHAVLQDEFRRVAKIQDDEWLPGGIPFSKQAARWPASGGTLYSLGSKSTAQAFERINAFLELSDVALRSEARSLSAWIQAMAARFRPAASLPQANAVPQIPERTPEPRAASVQTAALPGRGALLPHVGGARSESVPSDLTARAPILQLRTPKKEEQSAPSSSVMDVKKLVSGAKFS